MVYGLSPQVASKAFLCICRQRGCIRISGLFWAFPPWPFCSSRSGGQAFKRSRGSSLLSALFRCRTRPFRQCCYSPRPLLVTRSPSGGRHALSVATEAADGTTRPSKSLPVCSPKPLRLCSGPDTSAATVFHHTHLPRVRIISAMDHNRWNGVSASLEYTPQECGNGLSACVGQAD